MTHETEEKTEKKKNIRKEKKDKGRELDKFITANYQQGTRHT